MLCDDVGKKSDDRMKDAEKQQQGVREKRVKEDVRPGDAELTCYKCGQVGHISINCLSKKKGATFDKKMEGPKDTSSDKTSLFAAIGETDPEDEKEAAYERTFCFEA